MKREKKRPINNEDTIFVQQKYEQCCTWYATRFALKHQLPFSGWVADRIGAVGIFADYYISLEDMRTDIDENVPEETYLEYYDYCIQNEVSLRYSHYLQGNRIGIKPCEEELKSLNDSVENSRKIVESSL